MERINNWNKLTDQEQVYLWWEYNAANPDNEITFTEFNEMIQELISE